MTKLCVFCPSCGRQVERMVDGGLPSSCLRCDCGTRFPLKIEEESTEFIFEDDFDALQGELEAASIARR